MRSLSRPSLTQCGLDSSPLHSSSRGPGLPWGGEREPPRTPACSPGLRPPPGCLRKAPSCTHATFLKCTEKQGSPGRSVPALIHQDRRKENGFGLMLWEPGDGDGGPRRDHWSQLVDGWGQRCCRPSRPSEALSQQAVLSAEFHPEVSRAPSSARDQDRSLASPGALTSLFHNIRRGVLGSPKT